MSFKALSKSDDKTGVRVDFSPIPPFASTLDETLESVATLEATNEASNANQANDTRELAFPDYVDSNGKIDWEGALRSNEGWIRSTIAARVGEAAAVEEVFQEVALAAVRQKAPIQDPRKIGSWFYRLATTYSLLYRRSIGRKKKLIKQYETKIPFSENDAKQPDPLDWLLLQERRSFVQQATAALADDERRILTLKYTEDKSYKEIAEQTGLTVSAVQSKLHRARKRLKEKLGDF